MLIFCILRPVSFLWLFRYITALTDTEEEGESEDDHEVVEPLDELMVLLQRADGLHVCNGPEKKEGLSTLLERKEKVDHTNTRLFQVIMSNFLSKTWFCAPVTFIATPVLPGKMS